MLKRLYIRNFALIDLLDMTFYPGFSVITGETGAGKSIILGAIGLLLGQRADAKTIKQNADKCVIEAHFDLSAYFDMEAFFNQNDIEFDASDTIIRRELVVSGKSRAFVNDTPVPLSVLKDLGERLMDVHSQHQNLLLGKQDFQLEVIDTIAQDGEELEAYAQSYTEYRQASQKLDEVKRTIEQNREKADFLKFQYDELSDVHLVEGEQEELETKADTMTHAEDIKTGLYTAEDALQSEQNGAVEQVRAAAASLRQIADVYPNVAELSERLSECYIELKDIASEVGAKLENIDFNPAELESINKRLDRLYELEKKYRVSTVEELMAFLKDVQQKLLQIENSEDSLNELQEAKAKKLVEATKRADALTEKRKTAAFEIEKQMKERLVPLGMPHVRFKVETQKQQDLLPNGQDKVVFLFSANTSSPLQNITDVASGGEIARVMLALKAMISGAVKLPTIVFDEIDTGVSGKIAEQMAQMMQEMGAHNRQVISITHLPQIAAKGATHYKVYKDETAQGTTSHMQMLSSDERIREIAQMLSGENVSDAAIQNAKELLGI